MKRETDAITPDELLIRLIWKFHFKVGMPLPVKDSAFAPKRNEIEGISVFRMACVSSPEDTLAVIDPDKRDGYGIALVGVGDILNLGLSVVPEPILTVPGHCVIPEINDSVVLRDIKWKTLLKELAILSNQRIVRHPLP